MMFTFKAANPIYCKILTWEYQGPTREKEGRVAQWSFEPFLQLLPMLPEVAISHEPVTTGQPYEMAELEACSNQTTSNLYAVLGNAPTQFIAGYHTKTRS